MAVLHRVVIVGGGFGGLNAAQALRRAPVDLTLIDKRNFHLFQPLLYQVATGGLSPGNIAAPLRSILERQKNCHVVMGDVQGFDTARRAVLLADGEFPYDTLVIAAGAQSSYFGHDEWEHIAPGLKSIEDAIEIRRKVLTAFEAAERSNSELERREWMTFMVVGGGATGVELAGTLAEISRHTLRHEFRRINPAEAQIVLVDAAPQILGAYDPGLAAKGANSLVTMGVSVRTHTKVLAMSERSITLETEGRSETLATRTILWAAGVKGASLGKQIATAFGAELDRAGRVIIQPDLTINHHPNVFVIGDLAHFQQENGKLVPGVAPAAIQQGKYVAKLIATRLKGQKLSPFQYKDLGSLATIGRRSAIAEIGSWKVTGLIAWLMWLFIHLIQLVRFENRLIVLVQWGWNYITFSRSARLITGKTLPLIEGQPRDDSRTG